MCRDNNHGGRRCSADNKDSRRFRDKASKTRAEYRTASASKDLSTNNPPSLTLEEAKQAAKQVRQRIYSTPPSEEQDDKFVTQMIQIGHSLVEEAETNADIAAEKAEEDYQNSLSSGMSEQDALTARKLAYRANRELLKSEYIKALSQVRELGGKVEVTSDSEEASAILERSVEQHYPTEWINHSNNGPKFRIVTSESPAYARERVDENDEDAELSEAKLSAIYSFNSQEEAIEYAKHFDESDTKLITVNNGDGDKYKLEVRYERSRIYDASKDKPMMGGRPMGKGWVKKITPLTLGTKQYQEASTDEERSKLIKQERWVKSEPTYFRRVMNIISEKDSSLVNSDDKHSALDSMAYHEFGHRMEETIPERALPRMEEAFLRHRTGKTSKNFHTDMETEAVIVQPFHKGNFIDRYAGRDYLNGNYEVFTVGVEAVLGKNFGSLSGQHPIFTRTDKEHKAFILGILATL